MTLTFWEVSSPIFQSHFLSSPALCEGSQCLHTLASSVVWLFLVGSFNRCAVISCAFPQGRRLSSFLWTCLSSISPLCPFFCLFNWVVHFLILAFWEFFIYSEHKSFFRYVLRKDFLPVWLVFLILLMIFKENKSMKFSLSICSFVDLAFWCYV